MAETHLQMARRHVIEQIGRIRGQRELIKRMQHRGASPEAAQILLHDMVAILTDMRKHRRALMRASRKNPRRDPMLPLEPLPLSRTAHRGLA